MLPSHTNDTKLKCIQEVIPMNNIRLDSLPKAALDEIPSPSLDAVTITGLVKSGGGIAHNGDTEYLKSIPDDSENNNLSSLPTVKTL